MLKKINYSLIITLFVTIFTVAYASFTTTGKVHKFGKEIVPIVADMEIMNKDGEYVPVEGYEKASYNVKAMDGKAYFRYKLADEYKPGMAIAIRNTEAAVKISIEDKKIIKYADYSFKFKSSIGRYNIFDIEKQYLGKYVYIEFDNNGTSDDISFNEAYLGQSEDILEYFGKSSMLRVVCGIWLVGLGLFLILIWIAVKLKQQDNEILYIGSFSIIMGLWAVSGCPLIVYLMNGNPLYRIFVFELLLLIAIPITFFNRAIEISRKVKKAYDIAIIIMLINVVAANALHFAGIKDFNETLGMTFISMILAFLIPVICFLGRVLMGIRFKEEGMHFAKIILATTVIIDILNYFAKWYSDDSMYSRWGLMIYITAIAIEHIRALYEIVYNGQKAQMFKEIAHQDMLTKANSRTAYAEVMEDMANKDLEDKKVAIVAFDVNDLKVMNDTYGHDEGDRYLKDCVRIITDSFGSFGECYRTGGDEFALIISNFNDSRFEDSILRMQRAVVECQEATNKPMSISYGYAIYEHNIDKNIYDTAKRADELMYKAKREGKLKRKQEQEKALKQEQEKGQ
ncbi:MAG: GGDEF domain-containing protein [Lachnospiraceae bacterium]|nr:GGDEF domain-containing protein [Lachnospiraceae bacterium]